MISAKEARARLDQEEADATSRAKALVRHQNVPAMVAAYESARRLIISGFESVAEARKVWDATFTLGCSQSDLHVRCGTYCHRALNSPEAALKGLRVSTWHVVVDRIELRQFTSLERWAKIQKSISDDELPEPTVETINGFLVGQLNDLPNIMTESVRAVFEFLRPRNDRYLRNSEEEVPRRVVLERFVATNFLDHTRFEVAHGFGHGPGPSEELLAIERVFNALDGRGEVAKSSRSELEQAIRACTTKNKSGETDLFRFSCHKNGNLHLDFKRLDLLKRLNEIAGGKRLRKTKTKPADIAVA